MSRLVDGPTETAPLTEEQKEKEELRKELENYMVPSWVLFFKTLFGWS